MRKKACVITFGCQQNEADSEKIKGLLDNMGYEVINADMTEDMQDGRGQFTEKSGLSECAVIIMNSCAVREHAELKAFSRIGQLKHYKNKSKGLLVGICGCMIEQEHAVAKLKQSYPHVDFVFGTRELHRLPEILGQAIASGRRILDNPAAGADAPIAEGLPVLRDSSFQARVSIMYGCDNFCTYCVVPHVRGRERSRSRDKILEEVRGLVGSGYKDIMLLGQNVNSYADPSDSSYRFTELLGDIAKTDGDYLLRFLTSHPKDVPAELIKIMGENNKLAKHMHLPAQAGSDRILKLMNRKYTREYYLGLVRELQARGIAVTTDIIVGFPSESEQDFEQTLDLVAQAGFDNIFPFIYSKREDTPAKNMPDDVTHKEKTERFARLLKLQNEIVSKKNKSCEGAVMRVLVESEYKARGWLAGRTSQYKLVVFECGDKNLIGRFADVKINEGRLHGLYGELIN